MIHKLKPKSEFSRNVLTLMTGTTIAQAIPIAISPILTRIYTPEDFGVFALFLAITSIFGSIANGRYELAIMLPKKDEDAINIFALGFIITSALSLFLLIVVIIFHDYFVSILNNEDIGMWLYFVPITVFFMGIFNILNYFNNRKKQYKDLAKANIIKSIVLAIVQLSIGFLKQGATGLISGQIVSQFFANTKLLLNITKDKVLLASISKVKIIALARRYKKFPQFSMWAGLFNISSLHFTNLLVSSFYTISTLGFYSLVYRLLSMPSSLIGGAIGQVFYQEATKEKEMSGSAKLSFDKTVKKLLLVGVPPFVVLYFIVEDLFAFVFGEEWRVAGQYAQIVTPLFFVRFVVAPMTIMNVIFEHNKTGMYWQLSLLVLNLILIMFSHFFDMNFVQYLYLMTYSVSVNYLLILYIVNNYNKEKDV